MDDEPNDELLLDTPVDEQHDEAAETDDIQIEIEGDDEPEETPLIKQLRQQVVDAKREAAQYRQQQQPPKPPEPGPKPTLWDDAEGDEEKYDKLKEAWDARVAAVKAHENRQNEAATQRNHAFERRVSEYRGAAARLGVKDFADAEAVVMDRVPELLRNAVLQYAKDPAKVTYALGKNPARLDVLLAAGDPALGGDPVQWIRGVDEIERNIKVVNRRRPPEPEADTNLRGSAPLSGGVMNKAAYDKKLADLERKSEAKGGDRNEILAFKRQYKDKF